MTITQIYSRFLKDNSIYCYFIEHVKNNCILSAKKDTFNDDDKFISRFCPYGSIKELLSNTIGNLPRFSGASTSIGRRRFYRLNKKWKDLVKTIKIQHDLSVGDRLEKLNMFGYTEKYTIMKFNDDGTVLAKSDLFYYVKLGIYKFNNNDKKFFRNYYITNKNNTYGKVIGNYNEVQLQ